MAKGYLQWAFEVDDVAAAMQGVLGHGGSKVGEIATGYVEGAGQDTLIYMADPDGNIVELQS
jgi:catechol 2,3-dioxygenase-like lactoylglutathione lyase family enzyme